MSNYREFWAYIEGYKAFGRGWSIELDNIFDRNDCRWQCWRDGWIAANEAIE